VPRFVLLYHDCPAESERPSHWDLMLQQADALATWELRQLPRAWSESLPDVQPVAGDTVLATQLPDHRLAYLDYEGPVSGDRGKVHQVDGGTYQLLQQTNDVWEIALAGAVLSGNATLQKDSPGSTNWRLTVPFSTPDSRP